MIAHYFPPEGSAGSYRPLRFVRHLSKLSWWPTVISAEPHEYERYDPQLLTLVPHDTEVLRVGLRDPWHALQAWRQDRIERNLATACTQTAERVRAAHYKPFRSRLRKTVRALEMVYYQPDLAKQWIRPAVQASLGVCRRNPPAVIWATAGPVSAWMVAQQVSKGTGIPYVLDLRDPWGLSYQESEYQCPHWIKVRLRRRMYHLLQRAQAVVFLFDVVAQAYFQAFPGALNASRVHIIPNGYDGQLEECEAEKGSRCTVLYAGTVSGYRYDTLLQALYTLKKTDPVRASALRLRFVGEGMSELAREASALGLAEIIETAAPIAHHEMARLQRQAHAVLVLGRRSTIIGHELFAGAKLFGYLQARRPIVGILPDDETRRILSRVGVTSVADVEDPSAITSVLRTIVDSWAQGALPSLLPDADKCQLYSAEQHTLALVRAFEGRPALHSFVPGSVDVPPSLRDEIRGIGEREFRAVSRTD
jgi:hypothetical protein